MNRANDSYRKTQRQKKKKKKEKEKKNIIRVCRSVFYN